MSQESQHEIYKKLSSLFFFSMIKLLSCTPIYQDENILFVQKRLLIQCIQLSVYAVCICNSEVSFSEKWVICCKLVRTSQEIISITHDDSYRFWNAEKLSRIRLLYLNQNPLPILRFIYVSISCQMNLKAHFVHFSFSELCCIMNEFKIFYNFNSYFYKINSTVPI